MDKRTENYGHETIRSLRDVIVYRNKMLVIHKPLVSHVCELLRNVKGDFRKTAINHAKEGLENAE